jgi:hypothetical protein
VDSRAEDFIDLNGAFNRMVPGLAVGFEKYTVRGKCKKTRRRYKMSEKYELRMDYLRA